jgi:hypothetical protein
MAYWTIKVFVNDDGTDEIETWLRIQGKRILAKANKFIAHLEMEKEWRRPLFDKFQNHDKLHEIRFRGPGNIQYRLIGYYGPQQRDFTILIGAIERGGKYTPRSALEIAERRIQLISEDERRSDGYWTKRKVAGITEG